MTSPTPPPYLCLGTVQTGMPYGLKAAGLMDNAAATAIFDAAKQEGIRSFDTARSYGLAEARLGAWLRGQSGTFEVISKVGKLVDTAESELRSAIDQDCVATMQDLGLDRLDGLLCHGGKDILRPGAGPAFRALVDAGRIGAFGASVYDAADAEGAMAVAGIGLLQMPFSLLDRRCAANGLFERARDKGIRIFVRSLYTQGLLFSDPGQLPPHLQAAGPVLANIHTIARESGFSVGALALGAVARHPGITGLVVGFDSADQVIATARTLESGLPPPEVVDAALAAARGMPLGLADPRNWKINIKQ